MRLVEQLILECVPKPLPLTEEGKHNLPCHPIEEMDLDEIERIMVSFGIGLIETQSEDELCDLYKHLRSSPFAEQYEFDISFPGMEGRYDEGGYGPYLLAYQKKDTLNRVVL